MQQLHTAYTYADMHKRSSHRSVLHHQPAAAAAAAYTEAIAVAAGAHCVQVHVRRQGRAPRERVQDGGTPIRRR
jgi:hypothetical protein